MNDVHLAPVRESDARLLWEWSNDPETRRVSFSNDPIPWETHVQWLKTKLDDAKVRHFIAYEAQGDPVAQLRFDITGERAAASLSVAPSRRGQGFGTATLRAGARDLFESSRVQAIDAYIRFENTVSVRTFANAGFVLDGECEVDGVRAIHMTLSLAGIG